MSILKYIFLSALTLFTFLFLPSQVFGQGKPINYSAAEKPITIELKNIEASNGKLTGNIELVNPNSKEYINAYYTVKLFTQDKVSSENFNGDVITKISEGSLITYAIVQKFSFLANEKKVAPIDLVYGPNVISGLYKVQISLFSQNDILLGSNTAEVNISGSGAFLQVTNCVLVVDNVEYEAIIGPNVAPGGQLYGKCTIANPSSSVLIVYPRTEYAVKSISENIDTAKLYDPKIPISLNAKTSREITMPLPTLENPQVYEGLSYFVSAKGDIISPKIAFRWVIAGESSAIRSVTILDGTYNKGDTVNVMVGADPSMDLFWKGGGPTKNLADVTVNSQFTTPKLQGTPLKNPIIIVTVKDEQGAVCGSGEKKVTVNPNVNIWPDQKVAISLEKNCPNPIIEAVVKNNGKELASKEVRVQSISSSNTAVQSPYSIVVWISIVVIVCLIGAGIYYWKKRRITKAVKSILFFIILAASFIGGITTNTTFSLVNEVAAAELGPGQAVSVHYEGIAAYRRGQACPGPVWLPSNPQPQGSDGAGGCMIGIVSGHDETNFTLLDTNNEIIYSNNQINARIAGQFRGYGCGNTYVGLIVRAYINGSTDGVKINGGTSKAVFPNLGNNGGGGGTNVDFRLTITSSRASFCGPQNVKLEIIPFIQHAGLVASDLAEDNLIKEADVPGWSEITYLNRRNCGAAGQSCWGVLQKQVTAGPCIACGAACTATSDCQYAANGCTQCLPNPGGSGNTCQTPPPACNSACANPNDCARAVNGCTSCIPNDAGTGGACKPAPACNAGCVRDDQCAGARDGCTACVPDDAGVKKCAPPPACGAGCSRDDQCAGARNGCTSCVPNDSGQKVCSPPPACNVACTRDDQCAGAKDGCTSCVENDTGTGKSCKTPPACGVACTKDSQCGGAKDGCTFCSAGKCSAFSENMCSCDGMDFAVAGGGEMMLPGDKVTFIAYGKVPGKDWKGDNAAAVKNAEIKSMQFSLYQSKLSDPNNAVRIAQSTAIIPQIVENTAGKVRYKVTWDRQLPATVPSGTLFRIQATLKCSPKAGVLGAQTIGDLNYFTQLFDSVSSLFAKGSVLAVTDIPQKRDEQQAKTFSVGAKIQEKTCTFIKFYFE